jgi:hypothetical protein
MEKDPKEFKVMEDLTSLVQREIPLLTFRGLQLRVALR